MTPALSERALKYACERVEAFDLVNQVRPGSEKGQAVNIWLEHLGLDESLKAEVARWIERFVGPGWDGAVMIGLVVGLFINQFNHDDPS